MRSKRAVIILALLGIVVIGLIFAPKPSEPTYEGKRLSIWLREMSDSPEQQKRAANAVRAMGTNALPSLVRMLQARDSKFKEYVRSLLARQKLVRVRLSPPARIQHDFACRGLWVLGPMAAAAIPSLEENLVSRKPHPSIPGVLLSIGSPAWMTFIRAMTNNNPEVRATTIGALSNATNRLEEATPTLLHVMTNDPLPSLRLYAALAFAKTGKHEDSVVPLLIDGLKFGNDIGAEVARAFIHYPSKAMEQKDALIRMAEGPDIIAHFGALDALRKIDPAAAIAAEQKRRTPK
jgi:hypothetical protein